MEGIMDVTQAAFLNNWWMELLLSEIGERKKEVLFLGKKKKSNFERDFPNWLSVK